MQFDPNEHPHRRVNPLTGQRVLVSPHRMKRPWQGRTEAPAPDDTPAYDPHCYLCPGNTRKSGDTNPTYETTYVFDNDFRALLDEVPAHQEDHADGLFQLETVRGTNRVICFSPRHDLTLARMSVSEIRSVVDLWAEQSADLGASYQWVQVFENRGEMMGSSNPHPHGQIWALDALPDLVQLEDERQRAYIQRTDEPLLLRYAQEESTRGERTIVENDDWIIVVPYWATWPYETLVLPKFRVLRLPDLQDAARNSLAACLKDLLVRYDNLFETSFPYSMGWHGAPFNDADNDGWQLHAHFYPPLLRSATVRKFMVGFEMLADPQRDLTAEAAARNLQQQDTTHYRERSET